MKDAARPVNRLWGESSPYLQQHRHNPVDWYPWGEEALARAREADRPIFLSIGYSTCHWCHVMERESFEDEEIAALLNRDFVSIKVDREERPDIDNVYMTACQLMTHSGGWPLTAILTPDGRPFFAGTYFPPEDRFGRMGMRTLLPRLAEVWKNQRTEVESQATALSEIVRNAVQAPPSGEPAQPLDSTFGSLLAEDLSRRFDDRLGGFSGAPKFPPHGALQFLLSRVRSAAEGADAAARMLRKTLDEMQAGGIFDQVGGGFHRYSVDAQWRLPHFEKMLYDNAQLLEVYAGAAAAFGDARYAETARRTIEWLEREMRTAEGAYAGALDADSEGIEGKFYLWTAEEIDSILGPDSALYREAYGIRPEGNCPPFFEEGRGKNLPVRAASGESLAARPGRTVQEAESRLASANAALLRARSRRVAPGRDDKVLVSWNALAVSALARAARDLADPSLLRIADRVAGVLLSLHFRNGRLRRASRGSEARIGGFLEDHAFLARALLDLAQHGGRPEALARARDLAGTIVSDFEDPSAGGFFQTAATGGRGLLACAKEFLDQVLPSPNAAAVEVLERLDAAGAGERFSRSAARARAAAAPYARAFPSAAGSWAILSALVRPEPSRAPHPSSKTAGPVDVRVSPEPVAARPGGTAEIHIRLEIEPGWHVPGPSPADDDLRPARIEPILPKGWLAEAIEYPNSPAYSGTAEAAVRVRVAPEEAPGDRPVAFRVSFQACDDSRCLAPAEVEIGATVRVTES